MDSSFKPSGSLFTIIVGLSIFAFVLMYAFARDRTYERNVGNLEKGERIMAFKGDVVSADGYTLITTSKNYRAEIDIRSIELNKLDYFLKLFQIYAFLDDKEIKEIKNKLLSAIKNGKPYNFILSQQIDSKAASYLQELSRKLYVSKFFKSFKNARGKVQTRGLDIIEHSRKRIFLKGDILTPILGYSQLSLDGGIYSNIAKKGIEKYYEACLNPQSDYKVEGYKDIGGNIIMNSNSFLSNQINGCKLYLNVNLKLQKGIENIATEAQKNFGAKQVIIGVLDSKDASIVALATSKRYDPDNRKKDLSYLNTDAVEFEYEPGSVMKPIAFANLLKLGRITPFEWVNTYGGRMKLDKFFITDTHPMDKMIAEDIIVYSSNIGMVQISNKESAKELIQGYKDFNIGSKTGVDLPYEKPGFIKESGKTYEVEKNTMAYGYGFRTTFIQLLAAFNVFNNRGNWISPKIAKYYSYGSEKKEMYTEEIKEVLPLEIAKQMNRILIKTANQKSLAKYWPLGINVGGKTGTARISAKGGYSREYNANFFGFANDESNKYTIGVLVMSPDKDKQGYYASQTAVPVAALVVNQLIEDGFLKPNYKSVD